MKHRLLLLFCLSLFMVACDFSNVNNIKHHESQEEKGQNVYQVGEAAVITSERDDLTYEVMVNDYEIIKQIDKYDINEQYNDFDEEYFEDAYVITANVTIKNRGDRLFLPVQHAQMFLKVNDEYYSHNQVIPMYLQIKNAEENGDSTREHFPEASYFVQEEEEITGDLAFYMTIDDTEIEAESFWLKFEMGQPGETIWEIPNTIN